MGTSLAQVCMFCFYRHLCGFMIEGCMGFIYRVCQKDMYGVKMSHSLNSSKVVI